MYVSEIVAGRHVAVKFAPVYGDTYSPPLWTLGCDTSLMKLRDKVVCDSADYRRARVISDPGTWTGPEILSKKWFTSHHRVPDDIAASLREMPTIDKISSRAYWKLLEILAHFGSSILSDDMKKQCTTISLCEGPGGFIRAISTYRDGAEHDTYHGITLQPDDDAPAFTMSNDDMIQVSYGNIMDPDTFHNFVSSYSGDPPCMVTGDGGVNFTGHEIHQEQISSGLIWAQILWALALLDGGGSFVLKVFAQYTAPSAAFIRLLCHAFSKVYIVKPITSRKGNSERYIVCTSYHGSDDIRNYAISQLDRMSPDRGIISDIYPPIDLKLDFAFIKQIRGVNRALDRRAYDFMKHLYDDDKDTNTKWENIRKTCNYLLEMQ